MEKEPKQEILNPEKEEQDGLNRYYSEVVPDSICETNFQVWEAHLVKELTIKYPSEQERTEAIKKAEEFIKNLPLFHGTDLDNLVNLTKTGKLRSNFISSTKGLMHRTSGNTTYLDRKMELDHFVYSFIGYPSTTSLGVQVFLKPELLTNPKTRVSLEDFGWGTTHRLVEARSKGLWPYKEGLKSPSSEPEETFEIQKSQIWKGPDFQRLLPLMLALAYDKPENFDKEAPFPENLIPEDHLPIVDDKYFPKFEVRVPGSIDASNVVLVVYDRDFEYLSSNEKLKRIEQEMNHVTFDTLRIPPGLAPEKRTEVIKGAIAKKVGRSNTRTETEI